tara:strand:+ start:43 stop:627 length:585 start_codon:yes stop_codon:yes gene_type:complete
MKKFSGKIKISTAVFISGKGTNLKNLIKFSNNKDSPIKINLVVSNKLKAKGLKYATKNKITKYVNETKIQKNFEGNVLKKLNLYNIKLICLAGFMKILSKNFIGNFKGIILNIHPSLLPKYKGLNTHERALKNNEKFTGCTVHLVNHKLDSGKIIFQKKVRILKNDNVKSINLKVLRQEYISYPKAIIKIFNHS